MWDLVIIGGGPAALTAALYAARAGVKVKVFERGEIGGELALIAHIANYPGYDGAGKDLAEVMRHQAEAVGAEVDYGECTSIKKLDDEFELIVDGEPVLAHNVLVATGSEPRQLEFEIKPPVSYCALCDIDLVEGKDVAVIGGGNSAIQEALVLAPRTKSLTVISHSPVKADQHLQKCLHDCKNCKVQEGIEPDAETLNQFEHVFVFIGKRPATKFLEDLSLEVLDSDGYIITGVGSEFKYQTAISGLFAAGDVRSGSVRQVVTAAGEGASAAVEIIKRSKY